jgi:hypothetical protein
MCLTIPMVALAREHLEDLRELLLEHEPSFVGGRVGVRLVDRVADLGDQALAGTQAAGQASLHEVGVGLGERAAHVAPGRAFAAFGGRADEHAELVGVVAVCLDRVVRAASARGSEADQELGQQRHRMRL